MPVPCEPPAMEAAAAPILKRRGAKSGLRPSGPGVVSSYGACAAPAAGSIFPATKGYGEAPRWRVAFAPKTDRAFSKTVLCKNMGAWGTRAFENDQAMDWLDSFRDNPTERLIAETLADPCDHANSDPEGVIAAGEVVAFLCGAPPDLPHDELDGLPQIAISSALRLDASDALARVLNGSWLRKSWEETELLDSWLAEIADLQQRLTEPRQNKGRLATASPSPAT